MTQQRNSSTGSAEPTGTLDAGQLVGYMLSGVLFYGAVGWGLDRWLGTTWLVAVGVVLGAILGIYMVWARFGRTAAAPDHSDLLMKKTQETR